MEKFVGIGGKSLCPVLYLSSCFEILSCSSHLKCNQYFSHLFLFFPLLTFHSTCTTETVLPLTPYSTNEVLNFRKTAGPRPFTPPLSECRTFELGEAPSLSLSHALPGAPPILPLLSLYVRGSVPTAPPAPNPDPFTYSPGSPVSHPTPTPAPQATARHLSCSFLMSDPGDSCYRGEDIGSHRKKIPQDDRDKERRPGSCGALMRLTWTPGRVG